MRGKVHTFPIIVEKLYGLMIYIYNYHLFYYHHILLLCIFITYKSPLD